MDNKLVDFLKKLPEDFSDFKFVYREFVEKKENDEYLVKDNHIEAIIVDQETQEICFMSNETWNVLKDE